MCHSHMFRHLYGNHQGFIYKGTQEQQNRFVYTPFYTSPS